MKTRIIFTMLVALLLLANLAFIWGNSLESVAQSDAKSESVLSLMTPLLELLVGKGNATDHIVRKVAHFVEFSTLGGELALLIVLRRRVRVQPVINCLFAGLSAAVTDEALQLLSERGSQVSDVLLDFSGVLTGIISILLIYGIVTLMKKQKGA